MDDALVRLGGDGKPGVSNVSQSEIVEVGFD